MINEAQILASDPSISAWVSASAGTGKTRILTNRVLRLMLDGVATNKILCLTFTKAAAKEMENRINDNLLLWQQLERHDLISSLNQVLGRDPTKAEIILAPNLFKTQINAVLPIKIQTIHSFCQYILDKFPLEAKVAPGFKVIDEFKSAEIINNIRIDIISNAEQPNIKLKNAIEFIAGNLHEIKIAALIEKIVQDKVKFLNLFQKYYALEDYQKALEGDFLGVDIDISSIKLEKLPIFDSEGSDLLKIEKYNDIVENISIDELLNFFLTQELEPRKSLLTKKWSKNHIAEYENLISIQQAMVQYVEYKKAKNLIEYSCHLFVIAKYILDDYEYYKRIFGYLDYDDLIIKTRNLLINSDSKEWVLYKLDGGLEHILLDEAQDTSKEQWEIIEAIASEFYSGFTRSDKNRTLFVVGDEKQSIYSFQGADPACYSSMNEYFLAQMSAAEKVYKNINLEISYRSTEEINQFVTNIFRWMSDFPSTSIVTHRIGDRGSVEIWPTIFGESEEVEAWPLPIETESISAYEKLAEKIAEYIKSLLISNPNDFNPGDFLVLVRKRSDFVNSLIKQLENHKIKVAGIDRMRIMENIVALDILSLAQFVLLPEDDLNLAELLKSPFVGMSEEFLADLCMNRGEASLHQYIIMNHASIAQKLDFFLQKYMTSSLTQFFFEILEIEGFREKIVADQGTLAHDVINEFLDLSHSFQRNEQNSMQNFVFWLKNSKIELKRDLESRDSVRIMTVHGSKGLQAKVIILADSLSSKTPYSLFLWHEKGYCLFPGNISNYIADYLRLLTEKKRKDYEEYLRLLYVGLTRAEDKVIVASYASGTKIDEKNWYNIIVNNKNISL
jgi:ATP-dependent helicase/nuclease subunit A